MADTTSELEFAGKMWDLQRSTFSPWPSWLLEVGSRIYFVSEDW